MEVWSSSGTEDSERESSSSQCEEDGEPEEEEEQSTDGLCRELVQGNDLAIWWNVDRGSIGEDNYNKNMDNA